MQQGDRYPLLQHSHRAYAFCLCKSILFVRKMITEVTGKAILLRINPVRWHHLSTKQGLPPTRPYRHPRVPAKSVAIVCLGVKGSSAKAQLKILICILLLPALTSGFRSETHMDYYNTSWGYEFLVPTRQTRQGTHDRLNSVLGNFHAKQDSCTPLPCKDTQPTRTADLKHAFCSHLPRGTATYWK